MTQNQWLIILGVAIVVVSIAYFVTDRLIRKSKNRIRIKSSNFSLKGIFWLYRIFSQTPVLKRFYAKIRTNLEIKYPADELSIRRKTTLTMAKGVCLALVVIVAIIIMAQGDVFFMAMGIFMTYFFFTYLLTRFEENLDTKLLIQLGDFITDIRHHYSAQGNVEDAIYDTLDETPYEMGLHATKIYRILNSTNVEDEVDKYTDIAPNNFILTLVAICATIKEYGDKKLADGQSLFLTNINYLKEEINVEMIRRRRNNFLFSGLITLTLLPLFFLKAIEMWGTGNIAEMADFYQGTAGTVVMCLIFILTLVVYQLILNLKDGHSNDMRDYKLIRRLLAIPIINKFVTIFININYTKQLRIDDGLKMVNDRIGIKGFLVKRVLLGLTAVILINTVIFTAEIREKRNLIKDFTNAYESSIVPNDEFRNLMQGLTGDYIVYGQRNEDTEANREALAKLIAEQKNVGYKYAREIADEIFDRTTRLQNIYYRWYFLLINIGGFFIGYFIPYWILLYRLRVVKMNMEDEVIQYQTIVLILMHVDGIMIDTVLEWMERFAYCFKQSISECIINLEYSTQRSLQKMKNQETFPPFRRFVDNLLMVDDEDILTAFAEIETDREYYKEKRKTDNEIISSRKAELGKIIAFIPLIVTLVADLIVPFAMYAIKMMETIGM